MIKRYFCNECGNVEVCEVEKLPKALRRPKRDQDDFVKCSKCGDWAGDTDMFLTPEDISGKPLRLDGNNPTLGIGYAPLDEEES